MTEVRSRLRETLSNPFIGFAPWIVMSVVVGPARFELAAGLALGLAVLMAIAGAVVGLRLMSLDVVDIVFFGALSVVGLIGSQSTLEWLGRWSGELSNTVITLVALLSIAARRPFTLQYAREEVEREHWETQLFVEINYVITWVWTVTFAITALVGYIGDGPLGEPDNVWTNWIVQIALMILALAFTDWYPDVATARAAIAAGKRTEAAPSVRALIRPLAAYIVPVGIVLLSIGATPWWVGVGLIVLGVLTIRGLHRGAGAEVGEPAEAEQPVQPADPEQAREPAAPAPGSR